MIGLIGILLFVGVLVFIGYREFKQNNQKMESGEDKKKIQNIVNAILPEGEQCTIAYATYSKFESNGYAKGMTEYSWYYAIGFNDERIYIVPLKFVDKDIYYDKHYCIEKSWVAKVVTKIYTDNLTTKVSLFSQSGEEMAHLEVSPKNYGNAEVDVNVKQEEECAAFKALITKWEQEINGKNL